LSLWIDAQLSPHLAVWISETFAVEATSVRRLGLQGAKDEEIFHAARRVEAVVMTKDQDFVRLLERHGPPPRVLWVTCGNTANRHLRGVLQETLTEALQLLASGSDLVEISDAASAPVPR
jgi:predicted nuclease of predicted toxin-antitoxin system